MTALTLARPDDLDRLTKLVTDFHTEMGIKQDEVTLRAAVMPLLEGSSHGAIYLLGPARAPIGYIAVSFGWSLEFAGLDAMIDEIYIRPGVRSRGIGSEVLNALPKALAGAGLKAIHLEVRRDDKRAYDLYKRLRFEPRDDYILMSRKL